MSWDIDFISEEDFTNHVAKTIKQYGEILQPYNVERFNKNIIDPIKMVFDRAVYGSSWEGIVASEIFRQRDKSNNNYIGYFHQRIFQYMKNSHVPDNGQEGGWDVIVDMPNGYRIDEYNVVHKIYVEMKNKHNTMNAAASNDTFIKMMNQMHMDDDCVCFLVEVIAKHHQNIIWEKTIKNTKDKIRQRRIRRVSIDEFYSIVTSEEDAFFQICMILPTVIEKVLSAKNEVQAPEDTVYTELYDTSRQYGMTDQDNALLLAMYMLGFSEYNGFSKMIR